LYIIFSTEDVHITHVGLAHKDRPVDCLLSSWAGLEPTTACRRPSRRSDETQ